MKHVLLIAFHYPPEASSSGVLRTAKFSRYLVDYGWRVTVLTIDPAAYTVTDASLLAQIADSVEVIRTDFVELRSRISIAGKYPALVVTPDPWIGWYPYAVRAGKAAAERDTPDVVYSTSPHPTAHLIAQRIARSCKLPSVIDFRDPWYEDPPEPGTPGLVHWFARHLERKVVATAAHVVTSTTSLRDMLQRRYPTESSEKFSAVLNGFDEADFATLARSERPDKDKEKMLILHAGSINPQFRDPRPLFEAIHRLIGAGVFDRRRLSLRFLGPGAFAASAEVAKSIATTNLADVVDFVPRLDYRECLRQMAEADLLLLLQASEDTTSLVPAKLYEYLRVQRPVLALVRPGAATEVLDSTGGGWCCDPLDSGALESALRNIAGLWKSERLAQQIADPLALRKFDRRALTGQLASILDAVSATNRRGRQDA